MSKKIAALKSKKARDEAALFVVEGKKFVDEAFSVSAYAFSQSFVDENDISTYEENGTCHVFTDNEFAKLSDTVTPQGILAVCNQLSHSLEKFIKKENAFIVVGECINDPGNMGTLIRTADACGCDGIILSEGCVDIYNPKVVRSTAGSIFHLPIVANVSIDNIFDTLKLNKVKTIASHLKGLSTPYEVNLKEAVALLVGNEANGLSQFASSNADVLVKIPMVGKAESLNASVACGVLMYEVLRQRL